MEHLKSLSGVLAEPTVRAIALLTLVAFTVSLLSRLARSAVRRRVADHDLRYRASKLVGVAGYAVVFAVGIAELSGKMSGLTVAIGAASAGIAFALQEVIASFAGWLAVALGGYYKVGERVQLGGIRGDVIDIGFVRTTIMEIGGWVDGDLYNGRIVRVANSFVFKEPVYNYSGDFPFVWDEIVVPIKYGSDYAFAREILETTAADVLGDYASRAKERWAELVRLYRIEDARVEPLVTMVANDNWVALTLRYVVDHRARRITKDRLFGQVLAKIEASPERVGMASMTVHLVEAPALRVEVSRRGSKGEPSTS